MDFAELLATFADPSKIKSMPLYQLMVGSVFTTFLGMGVTFVALIVLQYITGLFGKLSIFRDPATQEVRKKPTAQV